MSPPGTIERAAFETGILKGSSQASAPFGNNARMSFASPSETSMPACTSARIASHRPSARRGTKPWCFPARLPPSSPVTINRSPVRAPRRRRIFSSAKPESASVAQKKSRDAATTSPPQSSTSKARHASASPAKKSSSHASDRFGPVTRLNTASVGTPPIAAISLKLRLMSFAPTERGGTAPSK